MPVLENNLNSNNSASFGTNVAGYSAKIVQLVNGQKDEIRELNDVPSGISINQTITLAIIDIYQDVIMANDNTSSIKIIPLSNETEVSGQDTVTVTQGIGTFESLKFIASPGLSDVKFLIRSSAIDYEMVQEIDPVKYADQVISVNFRWCQPGEIQIGNVWSEWSVGSYSTTWNSTECQNWPDNAVCQGKVIELDDGYWRINKNSTEIIECPNEEACLGGFNDTSTYPVNCAEGYKGFLWNECETDGDEKYERISENTWSKCPDPTLNIIRIIGFGFLILIFLTILIA